MTALGNPSIERSIGTTEGADTPLVAKEFSLGQLAVVDGIVGLTSRASAESSSARIAGSTFRYLGLERSLAISAGMRHVSREFSARILRINGL